MSSYTQFIPFQFACRLHCLQQGTLAAAGNTRQQIASLLATCITNANGAATFAKWNVLRAAGTNPQTCLLVKPSLVPGFVKPIAS
jgi:hypothetical protein